MAAVSGTIPNLIGGVEQRPPEIRGLNTAKFLENTWLSPSIGMSTRPNVNHVGSFGRVPGADDFVGMHLITKPSGDYVLGVIDGELKVMDLSDGTLKTVTVEGNPYAYLNSGGDASKLGFLTVADTTFIWNRTVDVVSNKIVETGVTGDTVDGTTRLNPNLRSTFWVKQRLSDHYFAVYVDGTLKASVSAGSSTTQNAIASSLASQLNSAGWSSDLITGSIYSVILNAESEAIMDEAPTNTMASLNDSVDEFADLPPNDKAGRLVLIRQGLDDEADDYWVWMENGKWYETYGWNNGETLDASTMPHVLIDNKDGTWTLKEHEWPGRLAGDEDSNPSPSFVGSAINHMFIYKGRMCVLADENFIASEVSNFENFYRTSCIQLLDDDPIDVASPDSTGGALFHEKEFKEELLLFSKFDQFSVSGDADGFLSPNTVNIKKVNTYDCSPDVSPVYAGPNVIFVDDYGNTGYASLWEYQVERVFGRQIALSITDSVPEYIPTGVYNLTHSPTNKLVSVQTTGDRTKTYNYHYYYNNEGKVQAAWNAWSFEGQVYGAKFLEDELIFIMLYGGDLQVGRMTFRENLDNVIDDNSVLMDYRIGSDATTVTYTSPDSEVVLPFAASLGMRLVVSPSDTSGKYPVGYEMAPSDASGNTLTFHNKDLSGVKFMVGFLYPFTWGLNPIFMRDEKQVPIQDGRLQLRYVSFQYSNTNNFQVSVTPPQNAAGRDTTVANHTGVSLGNTNSVLGALNFLSGEFRVPAFGKADGMEIVVSALSPWRVRFSSVEWDGSWRPRRRRT